MFNVELALINAETDETIQTVAKKIEPVKETSNNTATPLYAVFGALGLLVGLIAFKLRAEIKESTHNSRTSKTQGGEEKNTASILDGISNLAKKGLGNSSARKKVKTSKKTR